MDDLDTIKHYKHKPNPKHRNWDNMNSTKTGSAGKPSKKVSSSLTLISPAINSQFANQVNKTEIITLILETYDLR